MSKIVKVEVTMELPENFNDRKEAEIDRSISDAVYSCGGEVIDVGVYEDAE